MLSRTHALFRSPMSLWIPLLLWQIFQKYFLIKVKWRGKCSCCFSAKCLTILAANSENYTTGPRPKHLVWETLIYFISADSFGMVSKPSLTLPWRSTLVAVGFILFLVALIFILCLKSPMSCDVPRSSWSKAFTPNSMPPYMECNNEFKMILNWSCI